MYGIVLDEPIDEIEEDRMTNQTPLTQESVNLAMEIHALYCEASAVRTHTWSPQEIAHQVEGLVLARLRAIEAAAARRAIERVRAVASDLDSRGMGLAALSLLEVIESSASLPRPEEPRVERCAVCGVGRWVIAHDPEAGPSHHPFTPEAR